MVYNLTKILIILEIVGLIYNLTIILIIIKIIKILRSLKRLIKISVKILVETILIKKFEILFLISLSTFINLIRLAKPIIKKVDVSFLAFYNFSKLILEVLLLILS